MALDALAHETRLGIFRYLIQSGPVGPAVGEIGKALELAPATLSFHLAALKNAGLIRVTREGRILRHIPDFDVMNQLLHYLIADCCGGPCDSTMVCEPHRK